MVIILRTRNRIFYRSMITDTGWMVVRVGRLIVRDRRPIFGYLGNNRWWPPKIRIVSDRLIWVQSGPGYHVRYVSMDQVVDLFMAPINTLYFVVNRIVRIVITGPSFWFRRPFIGQQVRVFSSSNKFKSVKFRIKKLLKFTPYSVVQHRTV